MQCPYCQSLMKGHHALSCREMRSLERIDVIVADSRHFNHTKELLRAIFVKQSLQRKPKP